MNLRLLPLLAVAWIVAAVGCGYGAGHPLGSADSLTQSGTGNITFLWSFDGKSCAQAGIATVVVDIQGELLANGGRFACTNEDRDGITLADFASGTYPYTVSAYDASGELLYEGDGQVVTDGTDRLANVNLAPMGNGVPTDGSPDAGISSCDPDAGTDAGTGVDPGGSDGVPDGGLADGGIPPGGVLVDGGVGGSDHSGGEDGGTLDGGGDHPADAGSGDVVDAGSWDAGSWDGGAWDGGSVGNDAGTGGGSCGCGHSDGGVDAGVALSYVSWAFPNVPNAPTCGDELAQVVLTIDGQAVAHECGAGLFPSRVALPTLTPGQHALGIDAVDSTGRPWASTQVSIDIPDGSSTYEIFPVPWIVGSAAVDWSFFSCDGLQTYGSCGEAGVETIAINFQDLLGQWLYADDHGYPVDDLFGCDATNGRALLRAVTPGEYTLFVAGYGPRGSGLSYAEYPDQATYPVTVTAGVFLDLDSPLTDFVSVALYQQ